VSQYHVYYLLHTASQSSALDQAGMKSFLKEPVPVPGWCEFFSKYLILASGGMFKSSYLRNTGTYLALTPFPLMPSWPLFGPLSVFTTSKKDVNNYSSIPTGKQENVDTIM